jgi:hypothetical protein
MTQVPSPLLHPSTVYKAALAVINSSYPPIQFTDYIILHSSNSIPAKFHDNNLNLNLNLNYTPPWP